MTIDPTALDRLLAEVSETSARYSFPSLGDLVWDLRRPPRSVLEPVPEPASVPPAADAAVAFAPLAVSASGGVDGRA